MLTEGGPLLALLVQGRRRLREGRRGGRGPPGTATLGGLTEDDGGAPPPYLPRRCYKGRRILKLTCLSQPPLMKS